MASIGAASVWGQNPLHDPRIQTEFVHHHYSSKIVSQCSTVRWHTGRAGTSPSAPGNSTEGSGYLLLQHLAEDRLGADDWLSAGDWHETDQWSQTAAEPEFGERLGVVIIVLALIIALVLARTGWPPAVADRLLRYF